VAGVIVQLGGQTPLKLAQALKDNGVPIVGTSPEAINLAEERGAFGDVLAAAGLPAPRYGMAQSAQQAIEIANGSATRCWCARATCSAAAAWRSSTTTTRSPATSSGRRSSRPQQPVLVDRFLDDAIEIDVDALYDGTELYLGGVMEHIEEAGHPLGRLGLHAAPDHVGRGRRRPDPDVHRGDRRRAWGCGA
jgi:carbamoyl-phosphate synthase large subunit